MSTEREDMREAFLCAHEDAIKLRALLDHTSDTTSTVEVPRAVISSVAISLSFMAGWCLSKLAEEARDE